jgi:hypothetical protein
VPAAVGVQLVKDEEAKTLGLRKTLLTNILFRPYRKGVWSE